MAYWHLGIICLASWERKDRRLGDSHFLSVCKAAALTQLCIRPCLVDLTFYCNGNSGRSALLET